ncbi:hypothetical protein F4679DRAFT_410782 [Xylaria curta]|nr:hypothetical protein F4679DRAFT_410782 [Xylaria curta]
MAQDIIGLDMTALGAYDPYVSYNPSTSVEMPAFDEPYTGFSRGAPYHPPYPSTSQDLGAIPTSADTVPNVLAHSDALNDALLATATAPTSAAQLPIANAGTTSVTAYPFPEYVMPISDLGLDADAMMYAAALDPDGGGGNLAASPRINNAGSDLPMQAWLKSGRRSPGSISLGNDEDLFASFIDPTHLDITAASATGGDNLVGNSTAGVNHQFNIGNQFGVENPSNDGNPVTFAGNARPTSNDELINGVLFSNGAIADESSDGCTDTQSSEMPSEDLIETTNEEIDEDEELEDIDGVIFRNV